MQAATRCASQAGVLEMDEAAVSAKENTEDNENLFFSITKDLSLAEDSHLVFSASKINRAFVGVGHEKHKNEDINQQKTDGELAHELCLENRSGEESRAPYTSLVSLNEKLQQRRLGFIEIKAHDSLRIICRALPPFSIPLNLCSSKRENLFDELKPHRRRTKSTSDLNRFLIECKSAHGPGKVIINPLGQWIVDAIEGKDTVRSLFKSRISSNDTNSSEVRPGGGIMESKCSELVASPSMRRHSSMRKPPIVRRRCGSEVPDKMASCSSTASQSSDSSCVLTSKGVLCFTWKNNMPHFEFSVDDRGEAYEAFSLKVELSDDKSPDYMYVFYAMSNGSKYQGGSGSDVVGRMKVSTCLTMNSNNQKVTETEFILVGSSILAGEAQASGTTLRKHSGMPKKMVGMFRKNSSPLHKYGPKVKNPSLSICPEKSDELNKLSTESLSGNCFLPNLELAAIVVKDPLNEKCEKAAMGGWGLKFLEKAIVSGSQEGSVANEKQSAMTMDLLVPAGFHGGPRTAQGGPSSLIERWRTGGRCDCGGWDTGCPLTVLKNGPNVAESIAQIDLLEDCNTFDLFKVGSKGEPSLRMVNIRQGLYIIHFHSALSSLQAFSAAVAFIHTRNRDLCPKLYRS